MLVELDPQLQSWIIRQAVFRLVKELRDFDAAAVKRSLEVIRTGPANLQTDLPGGIRMRVEGDQLYLLTWSADLPGMDMPQLKPEFTAELSCPGRIELGNNWFILSEKVEKLDEAFSRVIENVDPNQIWCDLDSITAPLTVGCAHAGQRFQPLGMVKGTQKLSDFWVNVKLPQRARANWPVVFSGKTGCLVAGFSSGTSLPDQEGDTESDPSEIGTERG